MTKVLITGANGFLGSNLTRELYRLGYDIRILVRPQADLKSIADIPCEIFSGRIDDKADVQAAVKGCDIVIHAAAVTGQWNISFEQYEAVNFISTRYVAEAVLEHKVARFIFVSTANTIGPGTKEEPGTELNGFTLYSANSGYITTKYLAQQYVLEQVERHQLPAIIVNPTFMIGPYDIKPSSGQLLLYGVNKKILFCSQGGKNFVYIKDVCQGIMQAIDRGKTGECYLLAGENLSYREFFRLVNRVTGNRSLIIEIPTFIVKLGGMLGSLLYKKSKLNYTTAYLACLGNYYTGKKSVRELGITYMPVEEAIHKALSWFKENNYCQ